MVHYLTGKNFQMFKTGFFIGILYFKTCFVYRACLVLAMPWLGHGCFIL